MSDTQCTHVALVKSAPLRLKRRGVELRLALAGDSHPGRVDLVLLKAVARARRWSAELITSRSRSLRALARREGTDHRSLGRLLPLAFLAPAIVEAIASGRQPLDLTLASLLRRRELPLLWRAQEQVLSPR